MSGLDKSAPDGIVCPLSPSLDLDSTNLSRRESLTIENLSFSWPERKHEEDDSDLKEVER